MTARRHAQAAIAATCLAATFALSADGVRPAAPAPLPQQQPTFRTSVEVVAIDVNIVDRQARPVEGLKPEDFTVTVDRKPRRIVSAQYINHGVRVVPAAARKGGARPATDASVLEALSAAPPARAARNVMVVVDTDSLEVGSGQNAVRAARQFLDELPATDRVGVATIPRLPSTLVFTADRAAARKALDGLVTAPAELPTGEQTVGLQEAYDIEKKDETAIAGAVARECKCAYTPQTVGGATASADATASTTTTAAAPDPSGGQLAACSGTQMEVCVTPLLMLAHQVALAGHMQAQRSLDALSDLGQGLAQIEGPKTVVLVTGGLGIPETSTSFDPLEPAMATGQVTLYTLYIEQMSLGQVRRPLSPTFAFDDRIPMWGIENVTAAANGTLIHVVGKVESAFERVATEMSGSYLLAIEVEPGDRDGRPHEVNVKVNRSNVEVRARKRYVIQPEKPGARPAEPATAPLSAAARAARRAERVAPIVPELGDVTPELVALLTRAGEFALDYQSQIAALASDEQYEQTLSKWKSGPVVVNRATQTREDWFVDKRRHLRSDYVLIRGAGALGWLQFRDPFEVDGSAVRPHTGRLEKLFSESPATALQQAAQLMTESARYNLGFGERNMDVPTLALFLLEPANRARFFFRKEGETQVEGTPTWQIAFFERGTPTIFAGDRNVNLPLEGTIWVEPAQGRVVRSTVRLNMEDADAEITVAYRPSAELGGLWVPSEMREAYTSDTQKVECIARYSNFRVLKIGK
jgi:VWFA-related protein